MSAGPRSLAGAVNAWRAIRRAVTPDQVSEGGLMDFEVDGLGGGRWTDEPSDVALQHILKCALDGGKALVNDGCAPLTHASMRVH